MLLDPRLMLPTFLTDEEKDELISDLKEELELMGQLNAASLSSLSNATKPKGEIITALSERHSAT